MRFRVERSGGFAGLVLRADVEASSLPPDVVLSATSLDWAALPVPPSTRRDGFTYRLELLPPEGATAGAAREVEVCDPAPTELRPLLDALLEHAEVEQG